MKMAVAFVEPMAARLVESLPEGDEWLYEVKLDGYRALAVKNGDAVQLRSRRDRDLGKDYPHLVAALRGLNAQSALLDGEIVAIDAHGRPSFQALQHRTARHQTIVYFAFDLLHLNGRDLKPLPLVARRALLPGVIDGTGVLLSEELAGKASDVIEAVRRIALEGIIAKRRNSRYEPGKRTGAWVKLKLEQQQEFVVGGYKPGLDSFDSLLVGYYVRRQLHFAAKVRAGFTPALRRAIFERLKPLRVTNCPFVDLPNTAGRSHWGEGITADDMKSLHWVNPRVVVQVRFVEWTADDHLRHAAFVGIRGDKSPMEVRRERDDN